MRIALVLLCDFLANSKRGTLMMRTRKGAYAPTTLTTLASLVPSELNAELQIFDEFIEDFNPYTIQADIIGLSFTTPNSLHAYRIARILKSRGITVVFGGFHTSMLPEEASLYADACVIGYAEKTWPLLLKDYSVGKLKKIYKELSNSDFSMLLVNRRDLLKKSSYFLPNTIESCRSCINNCSFCAIPPFIGNTMQFRSIDVLEKEIKMMKCDEIALLDSSPAEDLCHFTKLYECFGKLKIKWFSALSFKAFTNVDLIERMSENGCKGVLIGFESLNQSALDREGKGFNKVADYKEVIRHLHRNNIYVFGSFIFGFDEDTKDIFKTTVDFVNECNIDLLNYGILTPLPGTQLFKTLESQGRILTKNWSLYDSYHVTFVPSKMSVEELQKGFKWAFKKTHSFYSISKRMVMSPTRSLRNLFGNLALSDFGRNVLNKIVS